MSPRATGSPASEEPRAVAERLAERAQRQAADPRVSAWVTASAGSGKTMVLTRRVLALLLAGVAPQRILCLTFTKAAAAEMANRINARLGAWVVAEPSALEAGIARLTGARPSEATCAKARRLLAEVLDVSGGLKIMTIHALCQSILRRFPLEAGVAPHFETMDERDATAMLDHALAGTLSESRAGGDARLEEALGVVTARIHESQLREVLAQVARDRACLNDAMAAHGGLEGLIAATHVLLGIDPREQEPDVIADACRDDAFAGDDLREAARAMAADKGKTSRKNAAALARWLAQPDARAAGFDPYLDIFLTKARGARAQSGLFNKTAAAAWPELPEVMAREQERLLAVVDHLRRIATARETAALLRLAGGLLRRYEREKARRALLDYDDQILKTRDLLRRPGIAPWVLFKLDGGLDHLLVDEAQDTNPEQWEIVRRLAEEFFAGMGAHDEGPAPRSVFAVGDVKQSIYSFQRADPAGFDAMRDYFMARARDAERVWRNTELHVSFRSCACVLNAIDTVFEQGEVAAGVTLGGGAITHRPARVGQAGLVELWPPIKAEKALPPEPWKPPIEEVAVDHPRARLARLIARRIRGWLDAGERLPARDLPIAPGDIMILVRRRDALVEQLVRALKAERVPVAGVDRMVITDQIAVEDLIALGEFLLLPEDDLTLATVLKSPLIGLDEDALFALAHKRTGTLWSALAAHREQAPAFAQAHATLAALRARVDFERPFELYARLLADGGRARIIARLGPDADDPLDEFLALALDFERANTPSLQGFLHWLRATATEIKRDMDHGEDTVRVMTVHGAKGLQAPIVFLPDTMGVPKRPPELLWERAGDGDVMLWNPRADARDSVSARLLAAASKAREDEYRRLLYVAMTRAEDRLYVCGWEGKNASPEGCWYNLIAPALRGQGEPVEDALVVAACGGAVLRYEDEQFAAPETRRAPAPSQGAALPAWARAPAPDEPAPPRPLAPSRSGEDDPPARAPLDGAGRFARGRIVHKLLQFLPDMAMDAREAACRRYLAWPAHGLIPDAQGEIAGEVLGVLADPAFASIFAPGSLAEVPITGILPAGDRGGETIISGQIDRMVVGEDAVLIVDYKTLRPAPPAAEAAPPAYVRQMAAYRALVAGLYPGREVRCALLWTEGPVLMPLPGALLDAHAPRARS